MDGRKQEVLRAVVEDYVATAEPVASRALAQTFGVSSATIRNEMAELEAEGYLVQRHTSGGRIPSDRGYRYYVDRLMSAGPLSTGERAQLADLLRRGGAEVQWLLRELGHLLAEATRCASVAVGPVGGPSRVLTLTCVAVDPQRAVLVLVTDRGTVVHRAVDLPEALGQAGAEALVTALSRRLQGVRLGPVGRTVAQEVSDLLSPFRALVDGVLSLLEGDRPDGDERVFLDGASRLVGQPEFQDADRIRTLLAFLDQTDAVESLLASTSDESGVRLRIGGENQEAAVRDLAVVTSPVRRSGRVVGYVAVLGPTRMPYARVVGMLEALSAFE